MINVISMFKHSKLSTAIDINQTILQLPFGDGAKFKVPLGDHFYATLRSGTIFEHVKVVDSTQDTITVVRGQDNTNKQSFNAGTCVDVIWNPAQLCEYVKACANGTDQGFYDGTACMTCDTCFEIEDGRIKSVNGSTQCQYLKIALT